MKQKLNIFFGTLLLAAGVAQATPVQDEDGVWSDRNGNQLRIFKTDGCTLSPDGPPDQPKLWRSCCVQHDIAYWKGGTKEERTAADDNLKSCIEKKTERKGVASLYHSGVQLSGSPKLKQPWSWGFGWLNNTEYERLDEERACFAHLVLEDLRAENPELEESLSEKAAELTAQGLTPPNPCAVPQD